MSGARVLLVLAALGGLLPASPAGARWLDDPLAAAPPELARAASAREDGCDVSGPLAQPLMLADAVQRALCVHPRTRQAWAWIARETAAVGSARGAYLPTLDGTASVAQARQNVRYPDVPDLSSELDARSTALGLRLNWVLYDFGLRAANLEQARQTLNAATAARSQDVQAVFLETAEAYYALQAAHALVAAREDALAVAARNLAAAQGRHAGGVGSLSDRLLAQTAHDETRLALVEAQGEARRLAGRLATLLALPPTASLAPAPLHDKGLDIQGFGDAVDALIEQASAVHPEIRRAQAELRAAEASVAAAQAQGRPRLSLFAATDRQDTPIERVSSRQVIRNNVLGVQLTIPIFEGFAGNYRRQAALADVQTREAGLEQARQTVGLNIWESYQAVRTETERLEISAGLLESARQSLEVVQGRYRAGVGSMLEVLAAQASLLDARQAHVSSVASWLTARLRLGAHLARLELARVP